MKTISTPEQISRIIRSAWEQERVRGHADPFLLNRSDNDIEYFYESQLASEAAPVEDRHIHPIEPRMLRVSVTWRF